MKKQLTSGTQRIKRGKEDAESLGSLIPLFQKKVKDPMSKAVKVTHQKFDMIQPETQEINMFAQDLNEDLNEEVVQVPNFDEMEFAKPAN